MISLLPTSICHALVALGHGSEALPSAPEDSGTGRPILFPVEIPPKQATAMIACWMVRDFSGASFDGKRWSEQRVRISILGSALAAGALEAARLTGAIRKRRPPQDREQSHLLGQPLSGLPPALLDGATGEEDLVIRFEGPSAAIPPQSLCRWLPRSYWNVCKKRPRQWVTCGRSHGFADVHCPAGHVPFRFQTPPAFRGTQRHGDKAPLQ
jgi:hypothetical protein